MPEVEVDPRDAMSEGREGGGPIDQPGVDQIEDVAPDNGASDPSQPEDVIDTIKPKAEQKVWTVTDGEISKEYVQKPLSYFAKMEFFGLVGEVIDKAVSGEDGLRVSSLFEVPGGRGAALSASDFRDADTFIQAVGKLLTYAPDFLQKCYCIWWNVPEFERPWVIQTITEGPNALSDDEGIEAIEIFIDQNWEALESFFREKISSLRDRVQARRQKDDGSQQSKPSNATQGDTPTL